LAKLRGATPVKIPGGVPITNPGSTPNKCLTPLFAFLMHADYLSQLSTCHISLTQTMTGVLRGVNPWENALLFLK